MARFNKLDVPYQWKDEFTKYPHGYSIFQALSKWVDQVNRMITTINEWNEYLEGFTSTFGEVPQQMAELRQEMTGLLESINSDLTTITDEVNGLADTLLLHLNDYASQIDFKLTNLIENGSFEQGVTGWTLTNAVITNNELVIDTANPSQVTQVNLTFSTSNKVYLRYKARASTDNSGIRSAIQNIDNVSVTEWHLNDNIALNDAYYSHVFTLVASASNGRFNIARSLTARSGNVILDNIMLINLTTTFGAGNEPTKEEMDKLIILLGGWFDGTITPTQKLLLNWQLKMIRQNRDTIGGMII